MRSKTRINMETNTRLDAIVQQCPNCGGGLVFNPETQKLHCDNCDSHIDFARCKEVIKHDYDPDMVINGNTIEWANESKIFKCQTCGAEIILDGFEYSKKCPYCGSEYVSEVDDLPGLKPDSVIPFLFGKEMAQVHFKVGVKKYFFAPSKFKKNLPNNTIFGIYVPSFTFDCFTRSSYKGVLEERIVTKTKNGTSVKIRRFNISGTKDLNFEDYVVESSSKVTDKNITELLPFDFENNYSFDQNFVRGFNVEHYNNHLHNCYNIAKKKFDSTIKSSILSQYHYDSVVSLTINTEYMDKKYSYRLIPVYNFAFDYKKKKYSVFMNGQTGKLGKGLPISPLKVLFVIVIILAIIGLLVYLYMNGGGESSY